MTKCGAPNIAHHNPDIIGAYIPTYSTQCWQALASLPTIANTLTTMVASLPTPCQQCWQACQHLANNVGKLANIVGKVLARCWQACQRLPTMLASLPTPCQHCWQACQHCWHIFQFMLASVYRVMMGRHLHSLHKGVLARCFSHSLCSMHCKRDLLFPMCQY
jgi:hypothetical protein